ncbi:hypothetical protein HG537_0H03990 [Torulaspora globosa]|uniref:Uncharacterized protein n=1 Tax=Torulaspora globosa TaxID=48254 RepID=A0A7H9I1B8_9SACH|nr:hypothetical protein HG537_0H03990 [Torulaspora sp. CBS 2947]
MNRVRNIIGHQHRSSRQEVNQEQNEIGDELDDELTVFERQIDDIGDSVTVNTAGSGSVTIGDLQRLGFVNRCPSFNAERTMPFASVLLTKGFFCFPSELSFRTFLDNKRRLDALDSINGLGIPLFHAVSGGVVKSIFNRHAPIMRIYRYVLVDTSNEKPPQNGEMISQDGFKVLFKCLFCNVYQEIVCNYSRVEHKFVFNATRENESVPETLVMASHVHSRGSDTKLMGLNLRWYGTTGFASPFGSGSFKLLVLDDGMPSRMDYRTLDEFDRESRNYHGRTSGRLPTWATYSDQCSTVLPKKRTLRLAEFKIGESSPVNDARSSGIFDIPKETLALTCMCLVLHDLESRKDKRGGTAMALPSVPFLL